MGILAHLQRIRVRIDVLLARILYTFENLEAVVRFLKQINKQSLEAVLRDFGAKIGKNCDIESGLTLHNTTTDFVNICIGDLCHIGKEVFLDLQAPIVIRQKTTISMRTIVLTHMDAGCAGPFGERYFPYARKVEIGSGVYIGAGAIILPGVKIGECSIVGAGALVKNNVPPWTVVAGVPAREIRKIKYY